MALQGTGKVKDVKLGESQGRGISTLRKVFCSASLKPYKCIDCVWLLSNKSNKSWWKFDSRSYNLLAQWFWCIISCVDVILIYFLHFPTSLPFWAAYLDFYEMLWSECQKACHQYQKSYFKHNCFDKFNVRF